ncbi:MAG TPA: bifunctional 3'-5' exonuclease/DNA polymerase [Actinomycetes bacterium]|nr:bifunctional 3'-5' exonuclease/DNA polymerase [Actinomycetes bacterium]
MPVALTSQGLQRLADDGSPLEGPEEPDDLAEAVAGLEAVEHPRWVWESTAATYPGLLARGVRLRRCHDLSLTDALLSGRDGHWAPPGPGPTEGTLFDVEPDTETLPVRYPRQLAAIEAALGETPGFRLLVAAESAASLAAAEMTHAGIPWRTDVHDAVLEAALGPPGPAGPQRLRELAEAIGAALDEPTLNPDSPEQLLRALRRQGLVVRSTRARELQRVDHPAISLVLQYKELSRLHSAHGWAWQRRWVHDGRFRPEYVVGGVVSGRWASRGGGALQIPREVRAAVVADPGRRLVVADARQLEPRVLAALSRDAGLAAAAAGGDVYEAVATQAFAGDRSAAKVGLLSAMYGGASPALTTLRRSYPDALALLEAAARAGERGEPVRSVLGRTSPRWDPAWAEEGEDTAGRERAWGRFTRNFVVQASAADWANVWLSLLRGRLEGQAGAELVFFQHDEVVLHVTEDVAGAVADAVSSAADEATTLVFGQTPVSIPLAVAVVDGYADAK